MDQEKQSSRREFFRQTALPGAGALLAGSTTRVFATSGQDAARSNVASRGYEAWALRLLGEIASHHARPDVATAAAHYGAAMTLASELEMRPLVAHCHLGLGKLYRRTGQRQQAQEHLTTATAMYGEMDMRFWLDKAEGDIQAVG